MQSRLIIVARVGFALGAAIDRFAKLTSYDSLLESIQQRLETQQKLIAELQAERAEKDAILRSDP